MASFGLRHIITASAPCRVDLGGHWDLPALCLPFHLARPCTVNAAINLRITVRVRPHKPDRVFVVSRDLGCSEEQRSDRLVFNSRLGLVFGIAQYFGISGIRLDITSDAPPMSGLGGSGALGVAVIASLAAACGRKMSRKDIVRLAHLLENGLTSGHNGIQDQTAAAYGGVNLWEWKPFPLPADFRRIPLIPNTRMQEFNRRLLVAYCGLDHSSGRLNTSCVQAFLAGHRRKEWLELNELTRHFSVCLSKLNWQEAYKAMAAETALRRKVMVEVISPLASRLIRAAEATGGAGRFAGAGGGGSVWALCNPDARARLEKTWQHLLSRIPSARILDCEMDCKGVTVAQEE